MNTQPSVAVVILNYNGIQFLEKFLPFVIASTYPNKRIIVADNCSQDASVDFLQKNFPSVEIIQNGKNYGFAEGYNRALRQISSDYYVLLNSDVEVSPQWIEPVISLMQSDDHIAVCQPKILSYYHRNCFEYAGAGGGFLDFLGYPFARGRVFETIEEDHGQYDDFSEIFWATGAAMFIKSNIYHSLGGLYDFFFAHQEEIDFCWRAKNKGFKVMYCGTSEVYHVGGGTLNKGQYRKTYLNFRNNLIMLVRNLPSKEKWWKIPTRLVLDGIFSLTKILCGDFTSVKAIFFAHLHFYKWCWKYKQGSKETKVPFSRMKGGLNNSIVFAYFIQKKKYFSEIIYK